MSINNTLITLSDAIINLLTADKDLGVISASEDLYEKTLPEDLNIEVVNRVSEHNTNFVAASTRAFGQVAQAMMVENKKLDMVSGEIGMAGKDSLAIQYSRSKEYHIPGQDDKSTKYGVTTVQYTVTAGKNGGELKKVRNELNELAAKAFGETK